MAKHFKSEQAGTNAVFISLLSVTFWVLGRTESGNRKNTKTVVYSLHHLRSKIVAAEVVEQSVG